MFPNAAFSVVVMAGLVPAIHVFLRGTEGVDARHKAGHDEVRICKLNRSYAAALFSSPKACASSEYDVLRAS